ncbi:protein max-like [Uloborus diversus]|uniref:protein max-like n=1 Tax=Uloborus diversus TaxID=327109 RepID=UPI0024099C91|nr:protein max-like [Uloborus diversus]
MSDDDRDNDIESDADKRAHHNALERKRRDHIKDSFSSLRDSLPAFQGDKASRAQILKKAADYIQSMRRKNSAHQQDIDDLRRQNKILEEQIRTLEKAKATGNFAAAAAVIEANLANSKAGAISTFEADSESDDSSDTDESKDGRRKRLKTALDSQLR